MSHPRKQPTLRETSVRPEPPDYLNRPVPRHDLCTLSRRHFLAGTAAGSLLLMGKGSATPAFADPNRVDVESFAPDLFVSINTDGRVDILAHRSEMGTGIRTGLPRVLADELEADWEQVHIVQAKGDKNLGDQNTDGSNSIRFFFQTMRTAGAIARTMLETAAAQQWGVDVSTCFADTHQIIHRDSDRRIGFGALIEIARTLEVPAVDKLRLKPREKWKYIGKDAPLVDLDDIVTGKAIYGIDARLDNQLFAVIARPPVVGGRVKSFDATAARKLPGVVEIVPLPRYRGLPEFQQLGGIAVCATSTWSAWQGRDALTIEWDDGPNGSYDSQTFAKALKATAARPGTLLRAAGDTEAALEDANRVIQANYSVPHLAHASMETTCAVADVKTDNSGRVTTCHILAATQNPQAVQEAVGRAMRMRGEDVLVNVTLLGSGFGRKSKPDYCVEAARLSRELKRPVHVTWTREDDLRHDYFHAISAIHCEGAVNDKGQITAWLQRAVYPSIEALTKRRNKMPAAWEAEMGHTDLPYDVPNLRLEVGRARSHVRTGWLRSVCHIQQNFAVGCFIDELAHAAGQDPFEFVLTALGDDRQLDMAALGLKNRDADPRVYPYDIGRLKNVLRRAAHNAAWQRNSNLPRGQGLGIACCRSFLGYTAHVVEVEVSPQGQLSIPRVWCSLDSGTIVSPDRVHAQVEGAAIMAASHARWGEVTFQNGRAQQSNFDDFQVARMKDAPRDIVVDIVESTAAPAGVGETGVASFTPALCNAIFAATGKRIRDLPLKHHDLSWS